MIPLSHYLVLGAILFSISVVGIFLNRKNLVVLLMAIELLLLAANMNFIAFSHYLGRPRSRSHSESNGSRGVLQLSLFFTWLVGDNLL